MILNNVRKLLPCEYKGLFVRSFSNNVIDIEKLEQENIVELIEADQEEQQIRQKLEEKRNKSRLSSSDRNKLHDKVPFDEPRHWSHGTVRYHRKMYALYGEASGMNPSLCWPTQLELAERLEYERVAYPYTIQEIVEKCKQDKLAKEEATRIRQANIAEKLKNLDKWTRDLKEKMRKKEAEATLAKAQREKLIEEVRRHFGYTVNPSDEKFKELLLQKEKAQKKAAKEERRKNREEYIVNMLLSKQKDAEDNKENKEKQIKEKVSISDKEEIDK